MPFPLQQGTWRKYDFYHVHTDSKQGDRATELRLLSLRRPHMRAFWLSTLSFFIAFFSWFSFSPLMPVVRTDLNLSREEELNANIASVVATVAARAITGPLCDAFGARKTFSILLLLGSIPTFLSGLVRSGTELALVRFFVGGIGATFVCNQAWTSQMFAKEIVGIANATSAGWGNLGGGIAHVGMTAIWHGLKLIMDSEMAWRVAFVVPASLAVVCSLATYFLADDAPKGDFHELIARGVMVRKTVKTSAKMSYRDGNAWILAMQYGSCFGVELVVFNVAATYFHDKFGIGATKASLVATLFGFLNIFSRPFGGGLSDYWFTRKGGAYMGLRGRLWAHFGCLLIEAVGILIFSRMDSLAGSIVALVLFSLGVQMSAGTLFSIVPYVIPDAMGGVSGLVSAGGSMGAIIWSLIFRFGPSAPEETFFVMGFIVLGVSFFTLLIDVQGHDSFIFYGTGEPATLDTI